MVWSLIEATLFGSMEEDKECDYDHILMILVHKVVARKISVGEDNSNTCKNVIIKT